MHYKEKLASAQEAFDAAEPADKKAKGKARDGILKQIEIVKSLAQKLETEKQEALNVLTLETLFQPGIFFNLTLAEQVSAGELHPRLRLANVSFTLAKAICQGQSWWCTTDHYL